MAEHGELIFRGDLLENLKLLRRTRAATATPEAMSMMLRGLIRDAPAVDAVPVVHGRWIYHDDDIMPWVSCSECDICTDSTKKTPYCPFCGARMDGERRDEGGQR